MRSAVKFFVRIMFCMSFAAKVLSADVDNLKADLIDACEKQNVIVAEQVFAQAGGAGRSILDYAAGRCEELMNQGEIEKASNFLRILVDAAPSELWPD